MRRAHAPDRRVNLVVLTRAGVETRAAMLEATYAPPPELMQLDVPTLRALRDAASALPNGRESSPALPAARGRVLRHADRAASRHAAGKGTR